MEVLHAAAPVDLVVGPSGYGLPWTDVRDVGPEELELMLLADAADGPRGTIVGGMGRVLEALKDSGLPVCFAPGVLHLTTVPEHRKANRIDMGTADKLCAVALAVWDQARRLGVPFDEHVVRVRRGRRRVHGRGRRRARRDRRRLGRDLRRDGVPGTGRDGRRAGVSAQGLPQGRAGERRRGLDRRHAGVLARGARGRRGERPAARRLPSRLCSRTWRSASPPRRSLLEAPREVLLSGRLTGVPEVRRRLVETLQAVRPGARGRGLRPRQQ